MYWLICCLLRCHWSTSVGFRYAGHWAGIYPENSTSSIYQYHSKNISWFINQCPASHGITLLMAVLKRRRLNSAIQLLLHLSDGYRPRVFAGQPVNRMYGPSNGKVSRSQFWVVILSDRFETGQVTWHQSCRGACQTLTYPATKKTCILQHDDVIKWKHFPRYWPFVRGVHWSPVNSPHKGQWRGALMFSLICAWMNGWVNNREAGDLRRRRGHYDVGVMIRCLLRYWNVLLGVAACDENLLRLKIIWHQNQPKAINPNHRSLPPDTFPFHHSVKWVNPVHTGLCALYLNFHFHIKYTHP